MYDNFDEYDYLDGYHGEENYHEDRMLQEAEEYYYCLHDEDNDHHIPSEDDGDYDDLLDELDFPF